MSFPIFFRFWFHFLVIFLYRFFLTFCLIAFIIILIISHLDLIVFALVVGIFFFTVQKRQQRVSLLLLFPRAPLRAQDPACRPHFPDPEHVRAGAGSFGNQRHKGRNDLVRAHGNEVDG
eukprot:g7896.t1